MFENVTEIPASELNKIISKSPTPNKRDFVEETLAMYADGVLCNGQIVTLDEFAEKLKDLYDQANVRNKIAYSVCKKLDGVIYRNWRGIRSVLRIHF